MHLDLDSVQAFQDKEHLHVFPEEPSLTETEFQCCVPEIQPFSEQLATHRYEIMNNGSNSGYVWRF